jgi:hypothetical protein
MEHLIPFNLRVFNPLISAGNFFTKQGCCKYNTINEPQIDKMLFKSAQDLRKARAV